jgi:hypothetical protein
MTEKRHEQPANQEAERRLPPEVQDEDEPGIEPLVVPEPDAPSIPRGTPDAADG